MKRFRAHAQVIDWLAVLLAASIPISTSATAALVIAWLFVALPTFKWDELRRDGFRPDNVFPWMLCATGIAGTFWAWVPLAERWEGLDSFLKLVLLPLFAFHFSRSERGYFVLIGYFAACLGALFVSVGIILVPSVYWREAVNYPTAFKNPATQSGEFVGCIAVALFLAIDRFRARRFTVCAGLGAICLAFLGVIAFSATARTPLVVLPFLLVLLAFRKFRISSAVVFVAGVGMFLVLLFHASPYLTERTTSVWSEIESYRSNQASTSSGERLEFWKKSINIISRSPIVGHGTGSIKQQMTLEGLGQSGPYATVTANPHQQTFAVGIQLGLVGVLLLWAMWISHLRAFFRDGLVAWIGLVFVVQNVIGSLFNSHLFDFTQGWAYVLVVGVALGMVRREGQMT